MNMIMYTSATRGRECVAVETPGTETMHQKKMNIYDHQDQMR